jgi:hypothetical protein
MGQPTGTYSTYQGKGIRENLADVIYNISPIDTPFMNNIGRETASNTYYEWQTDALNAPDTANAAIEGGDAPTASASPTTRLGNYTQISTKNVTVSGTLETVNKAGRRSEMSYQLAKRGAELKRDMESILCSGQAAVAGNDTTARKTAGIEAFIMSPTAIRGATGTDPTLSGGTAGYPNASPGSGTDVAFTEALLKQGLQLVWTAGGDTDIVMVGPHNKQVVSGFTGIATRYKDVPAGKQATIVGAADVYTGDFGEVTIVPNRFKNDNSALLLDTEYLGIAYLRNFQTIDLAKTGDAEKKQLLVEYGLKVHNHNAQGIVADLLAS